MTEFYSSSLAAVTTGMASYGLHYPPHQRVYQLKTAVGQSSTTTGAAGSSIAANQATTSHLITSSEGGDYSVSAHELIASPHSCYEVLELLGRGTFGQVLKCWKKDTFEVVAVKILKNIPSYAKQGQVEIDVLTKLSKVNPEQFNFVLAHESFSHRGHICIVFELLQINLYDYLKQNRFQPLPLKHIRPVAQQVLVCLKKLSELGLVHADLKPENIMLVDPGRQPFRVKVIDFGSTTVRSASKTTTYLQSRYYRAPEIILGLPYNEKIDSWSLGCVLAELYLGWPLFPGASEYDQISYICQMLGQPPWEMLRNVAKTQRFFTREGQDKWTLKSPYQIQLETGVCPKDEPRKFIFNSVVAIGHVMSRRNHVTGEAAIVEHLDLLQFISLLGSLLTFDPSQRASAEHCIGHAFISMQHLATCTTSPSVREWLQCMQVCCHSLTTHSTSPPAPPAHVPHPLTPAQYTITPHIVAPPGITYHIPHSTLAYYPSNTHSNTVLHKQAGTNWNTTLDALPAAPVAVDTGYVSADSSPTGHMTMDGSDVQVFFPQQMCAVPRVETCCHGDRLGFDHKPARLVTTAVPTGYWMLQTGCYGQPYHTTVPLPGVPYR